MGDMVATKREAVISSMISSLRSGENRKYYVGLVWYYIDTVGGQVREVVRVRLEVMIHDVWSVAEFIDGQQHDLFLDSETLKARLGRFLDEPH